MGTMPTNGGREHRRERGQILVLFALMLSVLTLLGAVLYSSAADLVLRRQLQNAGDAAALAAANLMENGTATCSSTRIASSGSGNDLYVAAKNYLINSAGWTAAQVASRMTMSCPSSTAYGSVAVKVNLTMSGPRWFGATARTVATSSIGINGQVSNGDYSVALLDPYQATWTNGGGRTGCASYLVNGGVTATYEGSIIVDSACTRAISNDASIKAQNSAFSMTLLNGAKLLTAGEVSSGTLSKITPAPTEHAKPLQDPLGGLIKPCHVASNTDCLGAGALPARDAGTTAQADCKSMKVVCVLQPGTYSGGILAANGNQPAFLLLRPGVYYLEGGGFQLKSSAAIIMSIPSTSGSCGGSCTDAQAIARYCNPTNNNNGSCQVSSTSTTPTAQLNWAADCPAPPVATTCGVMIYNAKKDSNSNWVTTSGSADAIENGSQGNLLLRAYNPSSDALGNGTTFASYRNIVVWQDREPHPTASTWQPVVSMVGGACLVLSGTVYAPWAQVAFGGSSCGSGGGADAQLTLQFIAYDLTLSGSNNFYFQYRKDGFATPFAYGLVP
jgi:hypothetical protein